MNSKNRNKNVKQPWVEGLALDEIWAGLKDGDYIEVRCVPAADPIWLRTDDRKVTCFSDADDEAIIGSDVAKIVTGESIVGRVDHYASKVHLEHQDADGDDTYISLTRAHVVSVRKVAGPVDIDIGGYEFLLMPDGTATIDGESVSRASLGELYTALGELLKAD